MERKKIKELRKEFGFTQHNMAFMLMMSQASYSRRETGLTKFVDWEIEWIKDIFKYEVS